MSDVKMDSGKVCDCCGLSPCMHSNVHSEQRSLTRFVSREKYDTLKAERDELKGKLELARKALTDYSRDHERGYVAKEALKEIS